ncbi:MAG: P-II family nitrogen regulator [Rhodospirillaceae bacterium]|jgi:nitrogen regulatory protein P-II 2|nr:P-II family nitrogen regulator [Rhodospirillaceae bacterium]MBT7957037.1 P-II family nitrogen regulator [Rhodospirillaceae bacterium]
MKYIVAIIKPSKLDAVREALMEVGVQGLTTSEVSGFGRQKGHTEIYRGAEYAISFVPKTKIEIAVSDDMADGVIETIRNEAGSENIGDGKIFVYELTDAIRIRTGERGDEAL